MMKFVKTDAFRALNAGFSLDEGMATPDEVFPVFYAERSVWREFDCNKWPCNSLYTMLQCFQVFISNVKELRDMDLYC